MHTIGIDHVDIGFPPDRLDEVIDFYVDTLDFETDFEDPHAAVRDDQGLFSIRLGETYQLHVRATEEFDADAMNYRHVALRIPNRPTTSGRFSKARASKSATRPNARASSLIPTRPTTSRTRSATRPSSWPSAGDR